jgi:hypothetical protein
MMTQKRIDRYNIGKDLYLNTNMTLREVCKQNHLDRFSFSNFLKSQNISTRKKIDADDTLFEKIDTEEKAYWLGFLYADGSITYDTIRNRYVIELALAEKDLNHLEKFKNFLMSSKNIEYRESTKAYRISIYSKKMCKDLIKLGCVPKKSLTLVFPNEKQIPKPLIIHFIRGYFDGDGSISLINNKTTTVTLLGTFEFLKDIQKRFDGIIRKDKRHLNNTFYLQFKISESEKFLYYLYNDSKIYLSRKYERYLQFINCRAHKKFCVLSEIKNGEG